MSGLRTDPIPIEYACGFQSFFYPTTYVNCSITLIRSLHLRMCPTFHVISARSSNADQLQTLRIDREHNSAYRSRSSKQPSAIQ